MVEGVNYKTITPNKLLKVLVKFVRNIELCYTSNCFTLKIIENNEICTFSNKNILTPV